MPVAVCARLSPDCVWVRLCVRPVAPACAESGHPYFYNHLTGETAWEIPAPPVKPMKGWELTVDMTSSDGAVFFTNLATGITQWEMPPEMDQFDALENLTELNISNNRLTAIASVCGRLPCFPA